MNIKYSEWDIKQIVEAVSKGVNSYIMNCKSPKLLTCEHLAMGLTQIYKDIIDELKEPKMKEIRDWASQSVPLPAKPESDQEKYNRQSREEDAKKEALQESLPTIKVD